MMLKRRLVKLRILSDPSVLMMLISISSLALLFAAIFFVKVQLLSEATVQTLGNAATAAGLLVVVAGIWLATMALKQSERSANIRISAARQWLVERRKLESQIDYLFFASPYILASIRTDQQQALLPGTPSASMADAAKSFNSVIGTLRRLRNSLLTYSENHGLLLAMSITRSTTSHKESDPFVAYMKSFSDDSATPTTSYLANRHAWLFNGKTPNTKSVSLSVPVTVRAITELICLIDYLDARASSLDIVLEQAISAGSAQTHVTQPSATGQAMFDALSESLKNIYSHLTVLRACLEKEWVYAFPGGTVDATELENRISDLLVAGDDDRFVICDSSRQDTNAGFRFGHAFVHLSNYGVFQRGPLLSDDPALATKPHQIPGRIEDLYT